MKRVIISFITCLSAPLILSWFAEPASIGFMAFIFMITAPVLIVRALPFVFQLNTNNVNSFRHFAVRSLMVGVVIWIPPFVILGYLHSSWLEAAYGALLGIILASIGTLEACVFWVMGVLNNQALTINSRGTR